MNSILAGRLSRHVNTFFAVDGSGNCLPGPYCPLGIVRPGPDVFYPQPTHGYRSGVAIQRFSQTHVAGTGGASRYGNVGLTPFTGAPRRQNAAPWLTPVADRIAGSEPCDECGEVGYYAVTLRPSGVRCELTCTPRVAFHRYAYPAGDEAWLLVDGGSVIRCGLGTDGLLRDVENWEIAPVSTGGFIEIAGETELVGRCDFLGGWGHHHPYSVFFCLKLDIPFTGCALATRGGVVPAAALRSAVGPDARALLRFPEGATLSVRVAISFVSVAHARASFAREADGLSFDAARAACVDRWEELFSRFAVSGGTEEQRRLFYTCLYRLHCMPADLGVDEDAFLPTGRRAFTDVYCLWDSIRNSNSFQHLFHPAFSADLMNWLLDVADATGWLPDAFITGHHAYMQSACACDILFAEAALKGVPGVDYRRALGHCMRNALETPPDPMVSGRYLDDYHRLGYLSTDITKGCVSRHIEYTVHDDCIARLAESLGDADTAARFRAFAARIWNLWHPDKKVFWPRLPDGSWAPDGFADPDRPGWDAWNDPCAYEGSLRIWSMNPLHDIPGLIARHGGPAAFVRDLDEIFEPTSGRPRTWGVKETRMHVPHLYSYAGRPDKAGERILDSLAEHFHDTRDGLADNEDMGCQSGYYLWHSMGLYPIIGQTHYMLSPPLFDRIEADLSGWGDGKKLVIDVERHGTGRCILSAKLGGKPLDRCWVEHAELLASPHLSFVLGDAPSGWGRTVPPPSPQDP
jgi:predicted alpha-1,2-mannosidase